MDTRRLSRGARVLVLFAAIIGLVSLPAVVPDVVGGGRAVANEPRTRWPDPSYVAGQTNGMPSDLVARINALTIDQYIATGRRPKRVDTPECIFYVEYGSIPGTATDYIQKKGGHVVVITGTDHLGAAKVNGWNGLFASVGADFRFAHDLIGGAGTTSALAGHPVATGIDELAFGQTRRVLAGPDASVVAVRPDTGDPLVVTQTVGPKDGRLTVIASADMLPPGDLDPNAERLLANLCGNGGFSDGIAHHLPIDFNGNGSAHLPLDGVVAFDAAAVDNYSVRKAFRAVAVVAPEGGSGRLIESDDVRGFGAAWRDVLDAAGEPIDGIVDVRAFVYENRNVHYAALTRDGSVLVWADEPIAGGASDTPTPLTDHNGDPVTRAVAIDDGTKALYVLVDDGGGTSSLWSMGSNTWGESGTGSTSTQFSHVARPTLFNPADNPRSTNVVDFSAGDSLILVVTHDGRAYSAGHWQQGQLGQAAPDERSWSLRPITTAAGAPITDVVEIEAGYQTGFALLDDGTVLGWGDNQNGELGFDDPRAGAERRSFTPIPIAIDAVGLVGGRNAVYGRSLDGRWIGWGSNARVTGNNHTPYAPRPVIGALPAANIITVGGETFYLIGEVFLGAVDVALDREVVTATPVDVVLDDISLAPNSANASRADQGPDDAALLSKQVRIAPLLSKQIRIAPLLSKQIRIAPLLSKQIRIAPLLSKQIRIAPLDAVYAEIPLQAIRPVDDSWTWDEVLAGTALAGLPVNSLSVLDLIDDETALSRFEQLRLGAVELAGTPLEQLGVDALFLGGVPARDLPTNGMTCSYFSEQGHDDCGAALTSGSSDPVPGADLDLVALELLGFDTSSLLLGSMPLADIPTSAPVFDIPIDELQVGLTYLADLPVAKLGAVIDCTSVDCATADLFEAQEAGAIAAGAAVADLQPALSDAPVPVEFHDVLFAWLPLEANVYGQVDFLDLPIHDLDDSNRTVATITYTAHQRSTSVDLTVLFPPSMAVASVPDQATVIHVGGATSTVDIDAPAVAFTDAGTRLTWRMNTPLMTDEELELDVAFHPGSVLGQQTIASSSPGADEEETTISVVPGAAERGDGPDDIEPDPATVEQREALRIRHLGHDSDVDLFALPSLDPGTVVDVHLDHLVDLDADLVIYAPDGVRSHEPLRAPSRTEPDAVIDDVLTAAPGTAVSPQPADDGTRVLDRSVVAVSQHRGDTSEAITFTVQSADPYVIQVHGYNGDHGPNPYTLRIATEQGPAITCPARPAPAYPSADATPTIVAGVDTAILVAPTRLRARLGDDADGVLADLARVADHSAVNGAVLDVERDADVQAAFDAWDAAPCDPEAANDVVRAVNAFVDSSFGGSIEDLGFLVVVGDDIDMPFARVPDLTHSVNEAAHAVAVVADDGSATPISAALATRHLLTDDGYADLDPEPLEASYSVVADLAIGRLVGDAEAIGAAIAAFEASPTIDPSAATVSGYEFFADMADQLTQTFGSLQAERLDDGWSRADIASLDGAGRVLSINGHATSDAMLPGAGLPLLTPADLAATEADVLFTIGCHSGLLSGPIASGNASDIATAVSGSGTPFLGQTGFGLGFRDGSGLTEELLTDFAEALAGRTIGEALLFAKQHHAGPASSFSAKARSQFTLYGMPHVAVAGERIDPAAGVDPLGTDEVTGFDAAIVERNTIDHDALTGADGTSYRVSGETAQVRVPGLPIQPLLGVTLPAPGAGTYRDPIITTWSTEAFANDPALPQLALAGGGAVGSSELRDVAFPAVPAQVADQRLELVTGRFVSDPLLSTADHMLGTQQLVRSARVVVPYSSSSDHDAPAIDRSIATIAGGEFVVAIAAHEQGGGTIAGGLVLVEQPDATGAPSGQWSTVLLADDGGILRGDTPLDHHATEVRYLVQVWDDAGNVAVSSNKGELHIATPPQRNLDGSSTAGPILDGQLPDDTVFDGFDGLDDVNAAMAGSTLDLAWRLYAGDGTPYTRLDTLADDPIAATEVDCDTGAAIGTTEARPADAVHDPPAGRYEAAVSAPVEWLGSCRRVNVVLVDGSAHGARFDFRFTFDGFLDAAPTVRPILTPITLAWRMIGATGDHYEDVAVMDPQVRAAPADCSTGAASASFEAIDGTIVFNATTGRFEVSVTPPAGWLQSCRLLQVTTVDGSTFDVLYDFRVTSQLGL